MKFFEYAGSQYIIIPGQTLFMKVDDTQSAMMLNGYWILSAFNL